jgi:hypothetical protein
MPEFIYLSLFSFLIKNEGEMRRPPPRWRRVNTP